MTTPDRPNLLLIRPRTDSEALAEALGVPCLISPLLQIVPLGVAPDAQALLLTSRNGVAAWVDGGGATGLPTWCVGPKTAAEARAAGLDVQGVAADADRLIDLVPSDAPPLLHARGADTRGEVAARLRARGLSVSEAVLYKAQAQPLSQEASIAARNRPLIVPVYSPRSAKLLLEAWPEGALGHLQTIALSPSVARVLPNPPIAISVNPDGQTMMKTILAAICG